MFCIGVLDNGGFGKFMQPKKIRPKNVKSKHACQCVCVYVCVCMCVRVFFFCFFFHHGCVSAASPSNYYSQSSIVDVGMHSPGSVLKLPLASSGPLCSSFIPSNASHCKYLLCSACGV